MTREECQELAELVASDSLPAEIRVAAVARILEIVFMLGKSQGSAETAFDLLRRSNGEN